MKDLVDGVLKPNYPDIRAMIKLMETCCASGTLDINAMVGNVSDLDDFVDTLLDTVHKCTNINDARKMVIQGTGVFNNDYPKLGSVIFNKVVDGGDIKLLKTLTNYLYKLQIVSDPEIQLFGMLLEIKG